MPIGSSFGEMLQQFRKGKRISQQQLAKRVECHRNSISLWERDLQLPETRGIILALAEALDLSNDEGRLLLEARYGTASVVPVDNLPVPRNPYFTGREALLDYLHQHLKAGKQIMLTQAISGLGGIGKTQTALEYAYRYRASYHEVLWIGADSRESLTMGVTSLTALLHLSEQQERDQNKIIAAVKRWLSGHHSWLLILDNVEDLGLIDMILPPRHQGAVLLTTRRAVTEPVAQSVTMETMSDEEGTLFLLKRTKRISLDSSLENAPLADRRYALAITQALRGLPLALDQAGAYILETSCDLSDYLSLYEQQRETLLHRRGYVPSDHPASVAMTLSLTFDQVRQKSLTALELLRLCAFLAPDAIPEEIITVQAVPPGTHLYSMAVDPLLLDEAISTLRMYSLLQRDRTTHTLSIHRLVQAVMQDTMVEQERVHWQQQMIQVLSALFPDVTYEVWKQCERLIPHVLLCTTFVTERAHEQELAALLNRAADYLRERAQYEQAEPLFQRALHIWEQSLGSEHLQVASPVSGLAWIYYEQGKYELAEPLFQRALRINEQVLGSQHPNVASLLNRLAALYTLQGKYEQAEPLFQRVLHIWEQALGAEHLQVATALNNLGFLYRQLGKYEQAEQLNQRALRINEQVLGGQHPNVAYSLNNLAALYTLQEKYEQAEPLFQRALHISKQALGAKHPRVAYPLNGLAIIYRQQGKYEQAEPLFQRALHIWEQALGAEHPDVAYVLNGLANLYTLQGKYEQAEPLFQQALAIRQSQLGRQHPDLAESLHDLAHFYELQKQPENALVFYRQALAIREQQLGLLHPETMNTHTRYIQLLRKMGYMP